MLLRDVQTLIKSIRDREQRQAAMHSLSVSTSTSFILAALRGKWVEPAKLDPYALASEAEKQEPISPRAAKEFLAASAAGHMPSWVVNLAPIRRLRSLAGRDSVA